MTPMIDELKKIVKNYSPKSFGILVKANKPLKLFIDKFKNQNNIKSNGEAIFCLYNNQLPEKCNCGAKKIFFNFVNGYRPTCGTKECVAKSKSNTAKEYFKNNPEIMKNSIAKRNKTILEKYGVRNISQLAEIKERKKQTTVKNFGVDNPQQCEQVQKKTKKTCLQKYGVTNPQQCEQVQKKTKKTCLQKYGVEYVSQSKSAKESKQKTIFSKYNVDFTSQKHISVESLNILKDKNLLELALKNNNVKIVAENFCVNPSTIYDYINLHKIDYSKPNFSSYEQDICNWLLNNSIKYESNTKNLIPPFELDLYLPDYNLAIEFDGLYWHSENSGGKNKNYHINKTHQCQKNGIRLIHIFEDEWLRKKELCLDLLNRFLNLSSKSVMARKCKIKNVAPSEAKIFLQNNHLQGYASASVYLGLYCEQELIQIMSFKHSRYNKNIEWENIRCCNKINYKVVGGVQKIWHHFINNYNPKSVISYCDNRWFLGETYKKLGFFLNQNNPPQYNYTDHHMRWHRSLYTKKKCIKKAKILNIIDENILLTMTEKQIALNILGLDRIWDSGQTVWVWKCK
jgi:hypothetical protein